MQSISTGNQSLVKLERKGGKLLIFDEYFKHLISYFRRLRYSDGYADVSSWVKEAQENMKADKIHSRYH